MPAWSCRQKARLELQHFEFVPIGLNRALVVLVRADGQVENRLIDLPRGVPASGDDPRNKLHECAKLANSNMADAAANAVRSEIAAHRAELDELSKSLGETGAWDSGRAVELDAPAAMILRGQANLLDDSRAANGLVAMRNLFRCA